MSVNIRFPNITGKTEAEQLIQVKSYLHQLVEQLNWALSTIESGKTADSNLTAGKTGSSNAIQPAATTEFNELKALIIKSSAQPADVKLSKTLKAKSWYKIGTITGDMCAVVTVTIGGIFENNQASPAMVDIATQYNSARAFLRIPCLVDSQISKIGLVKESTKVYGLYVYYNNTVDNPVKANIHTHMGEFVSADWVATSLSETEMISVTTLKE